MIVIADASPLHYFILIGHADVFPNLFGTVVIPPEVQLELQHENAPAAVRAWMLAKPSWLHVLRPESPPDAAILDLDPGEGAALQLALEHRGSLVLIDDQAGRQVAKELSIAIQGTFGILENAAKLNLVNLRTALQALRKTNFRASEKVWRDFEALVDQQ